MIQPRGQVRRPGCGQMAHYGSHSAGVLPGWSLLSGGLVWTPCPPLPAGMLWGGGGGSAGRGLPGRERWTCPGVFAQPASVGAAKGIRASLPQHLGHGVGGSYDPAAPRPHRPSVRPSSVCPSVLCLRVLLPSLVWPHRVWGGGSRPPVEVCAASAQRDGVPVVPVPAHHCPRSVSMQWQLPW